MFTRNEGSIDRILRVIVGLALLAGFFVFPEAAYRWAFLLGVIPLVTGLVGTCPLYSIFGLSTCPVKRP
ncbi:YgaP family membrane protein [Pararhodobacter aggregans]